MCKKYLILLLSLLMVVAVFGGGSFIKREMNNRASYKQAIEYLADGDYENAYKIFDELRGYKNSDQLVQETIYQNGISKMNIEEYELALELFQTIPEYKESASKIEKIQLYLQNEQANKTQDINQNDKLENNDTNQELITTYENKDAETPIRVEENTKIENINGCYSRTVDRDNDTYYLLSVSIDEGGIISISYTLYHKDCNFEGGRITGYSLFYNEQASWNEEEQSYLLERGTSKYTISVQNTKEILVETDSEKEYDQLFVGKYLRDD